MSACQDQICEALSLVLEVSQSVELVGPLDTPGTGKHILVILQMQWPQTWCQESANLHHKEAKSQKRTEQISVLFQ